MDKIPYLDTEQLNLLQDTHFLLSKWKILEQLQKLLAESEQELVKTVRQENFNLPQNCLLTAGKISRGENYLGLPYLVLDYPRLFNKKDIFTFRTMCWWGNFFSCTLHLQGSILASYRAILKKTLITTQLPPDTYICTNSTPWEYHYQPDNYQLASSLQKEHLHFLLEQEFLKLSRKTPLHNYQALPSFSTACLKTFMALLRIE